MLTEDRPLLRKKAPTAVGAFCVLPSTDQPGPSARFVLGVSGVVRAGPLVEIIGVAVRDIPLLLLWQDLKRVLWWWGWQCPFQCVRITVPWVGHGHFCTALKRIRHDPEEEQEGRKAQEGTPA